MIVHDQFRGHSDLAVRLAVIAELVGAGQGVVAPSTPVRDHLDRLHTTDRDRADVCGANHRRFDWPTVALQREHLHLLAPRGEHGETDRVAGTHESSL